MVHLYTEVVEYKVGVSVKTKKTLFTKTPMVRSTMRVLFKDLCLPVLLSRSLGVVMDVMILWFNLLETRKFLL